MKRNKECAPSKIHFVFAVSLCLAVTAKSPALELSIIESGPESNAEVSLWVRDLTNSIFDVNRLVSPSGDVFTEDSILRGIALGPCYCNSTPFQMRPITS